ARTLSADILKRRNIMPSHLLLTAFIEPGILSAEMKLETLLLKGVQKTRLTAAERRLPLRKSKIILWLIQMCSMSQLFQCQIKLLVSAHANLLFLMNNQLLKQRLKSFSEKKALQIIKHQIV